MESQNPQRTNKKIKLKEKETRLYQRQRGGEGRTEGKWSKDINLQLQDK